MHSDNTVSTAEAATAAGVEKATIRGWKRRKFLQPVSFDADGLPRFSLIDVLRVGQEKAKLGRPRNSQLAERRLSEIDWKLADVEHYLSAASEAFGDIEDPDKRRDVGSMIRTVIGRLGFRGDPDGTPVHDLRGWVDEHRDNLRSKLIEVFNRECAEIDARELRMGRRGYTAGSPDDELAS